MLEQLHMDMRVWGICRLTIVAPDATFSLSVFPREEGYLLDVSSSEYFMPIVERQASNIMEAMALLSKYQEEIRNGVRYRMDSTEVVPLVSAQGWLTAIKEDKSGMFNPPIELEDEHAFMGISYGIFLRNGEYGYYIPVLDESDVCGSKQDAHTHAKSRIRKLLRG